MRVKTLLTVGCWALAGMLMVPMMSTSTASAAQLVVAAGPIQTWRIVNGLPEPTVPPALVALVPGHEADTATDPQSTGPQTAGSELPGTEGHDDQASDEPVPDVPESAAPDPADGSEGAAGAAPTPDVDLSDCGDLAAYDEIVYGTPGDDHLVAGAGRQVLVGLGGDDTLSGGEGGDCLVGGAGDDQLDTGDDPGDTCVATDTDDEVLECGDGDASQGPTGSSSDGPATDATEAPPAEPEPSPEPSPGSQPAPAGAEAADPGRPVG